MLPWFGEPTQVDTLSVWIVETHPSHRKVWTRGDYDEKVYIIRPVSHPGGIS